jgi:hypothetical protein
VLASLERPVRGEIAFIFEPPPPEIIIIEPGSDDAGIDSEIDDLLEAGLAPSAIAKRLSAAGGRSRADIYGRVVARAKARND